MKNEQFWGRDAIPSMLPQIDMVLSMYWLIKSNQIKSNQIKSNQFKSNQIKSNQISACSAVVCTHNTTCAQMVCVVLLPQCTGRVCMWFALHIYLPKCDGPLIDTYLPTCCFTIWSCISYTDWLDHQTVLGAFQLKVAFCGTLANQFLICAIGSRQENSFKLLRVEMENYSHPHDNGNVLNRISMDISQFNKSLWDKI